MQRGTYDTVTVSILIPTSAERSEGRAFRDDDWVRVRAFTRKEMDGASALGKNTWRQISRWRKSEILHIVSIIRALESNDQQAVQDAILALKARSYAPDSLAMRITKRNLNAPEYPQDTLVYELCRQLDEVRLVLWKTQGRIAPGILCADVQTAFLVHVLMSAVGAKASLRLCPKCGTTFMQKRQDQDYCSVKCREAHRVERWRRKKASAQGMKGTKRRGAK
jgi:hypothetical protein